LDDVYMGDGRAALNAQDIFRALALYRRACLIQMAVLGLLATLLAW
jgi:adenosylcobinamide-phosphate synthase